MSLNLIGNAEALILIIHLTNPLSEVPRTLIEFYNNFFMIFFIWAVLCMLYIGAFQRVPTPLIHPQILHHSMFRMHVLCCSILPLKLCWYYFATKIFPWKCILFNAQIILFNLMLKFYCSIKWSNFIVQYNAQILFLYFKSFVTCILVTVVDLSFMCLLYKFSQQDIDI